VEVSTLPIAEFSSNGEHIAGIADAKARLVRETDGEIQRAIVDGVSDEVHHLAVDFRIFPTQPPLPLLTASFHFSAFLRSYRCHGCPPLLPMLSGVFLLPLLLCFPTFFRLGHCRVRENAANDAGRQS